MFRLRIRASLYIGAVLRPRVTWNQEGARIPGTVNNALGRALGTGHLSPRGLNEDDLEGRLLYWGP
jgi:hypothetical protein